MAFQITSLTIVYSTVYSGADQRKHQSSASLAFVRGIHRWPVNSQHKGPITRKMFTFDDVIMCIETSLNDPCSDKRYIFLCSVLCSSILGFCTIPLWYFVIEYTPFVLIAHLSQRMLWVLRVYLQTNENITHYQLVSSLSSSPGSNPSHYTNLYNSVHFVTDNQTESCL